MSEHEVVILGAGMSGLCMAMQLQRAGQHDFVMLEKQPGLGGTWWDNTYPGAHVDVPSPVYSFSFAPNPGWTRRFAGAREIQTYMQQLAERHGLLAHIRLSTRLTEARFDEASGHWHFTTEDAAPAALALFRLQHRPAQPAALARHPRPGHASRASACTPRAGTTRVPLAGQRVAVIGTGSTASQLIAPIAEAGETAACVPAHRQLGHAAAGPPLQRARPRARALPASTTAWCAGAGCRCWNGAAAALTKARWRAKACSRPPPRTASARCPDATLRAQLTPDYPLGCKRIIYSNDFFPALGQPHVELVTTPIERFTETGIVTTDGSERAIDVLVCATGFDTQHLLSSITVTGRGGLTLAQAWQAGPEAYQGVSVAGFPNLFLMLGPNTATGHTSTLLYIEPEVQHAIACMQAVRAGGHRSVEVTRRPWWPTTANCSRAWAARSGASAAAGTAWTAARSWPSSPASPPST